MAQAGKKIGYRIDLKTPYDNQITSRDRFGRGVNLVASLLLMYLLPAWFFWYWGSIMGIPIIGGFIGFAVGGYVAARLIPSRFLINNPEWTAYVTQNMFTGKMVPYGPGLHPSYWWEQHSKEGNYPLNVITRSFTTSIATKTSKVVIGVEYEYAISLKDIMRAIGIDESTIENGITAFIESFLISRCARDDAEKVRGDIDALNEALANEFMETETGGRDPRSFENTYGFVTVGIVISSIALPEAVQKTRDAVDEAAQLHAVVAKLYGLPPEELSRKLASKEISLKDYNTMLNRAMATSDNAKMDVTVLEADIPALLGKVASRFAKGGVKQ